MHTNTLIGHEAARGFLEKSIAQDKVSHAYCFTGPAHIGKTALAEWFVGELVGRSASERDDDFAAFRTNPDVAIIRREVGDDPPASLREALRAGRMKSGITVEQIRALREKLSMSSFLNSWKVAVILEAETMTLGAANAILKTLEEPRLNTVIILIATAWEQLPQTIRSRCQTVYLRPVSRATLKRAFAKAGLGRDLVQTAIALSGGRPGIARKLLEDNTKLQEELQSYEDCALLLAGSRVARFQAAEVLAKDKMEQGWHDLIARIRVILHDLLLPRDNSDVCFFAQDFKPLAGLRVRITRSDALHLLDRLDEVSRAIREKVNPRLALEHLLLSF